MNDIKYGRNTKGIKKELNEKISDWLASITDTETMEAAAEDVIVTGGCIASMLLGEQVNDFDLYFKTKKTTLLVAKYYADVFNKKHDPLIKIEVEEKVVKNIKGKNENRILCYIKSNGVAEEPKNIRKKDRTKYRPVFISENAITLSHKIQLVTRFYGEPDKIHDNYDFIHATCYFIPSNNELVTPEPALLSLMSRTLVYHGSLYPIASVFRTKKFINRGWRITAGQQLKMMWQISEIDLSDYETLREQLTGVDQFYLWQLIKALKDTDRAKINSAYVAKIIDKIF